MTKLIVLVVALIFQSCISNERNIDTTFEENNDIQDTISKADTSHVLFDTLFFHKNMKGEILDNKFKDGKEKLGFYKKFVVSEKIDSLEVITEKHSKTEIKYLGRLNDLKNDNVYHVITNFKIIGIGEMLSPRGRSEVAFVNTKDDNIITYDLGMPENLPISINDNVLYFLLDETKVGVSISGGLPPMICLPIINCH
jgi:hypothetical protein